MRLLIISISVIIVILLLIQATQSQYDGYEYGYGSLQSENTNEWDRYMERQHSSWRKKLREKKRRRKQKKRKNKLNNQFAEEQVSPNFKLSRTRSGFIVKQLEPGQATKGSGGFEYPKEPALMTNIKYKFDGSVAPVIKLSETGHGMVSKKLEHSIAKNPGADWSKHNGAVKTKFRGRSIESINGKGQVFDKSGVSPLFSDGKISVRGTLAMKPNAAKLYSGNTYLSSYKKIANNDDDYGNEIDNSQVKKDDSNAYEIEDGEFDPYDDDYDEYSNEGGYGDNYDDGSNGGFDEDNYYENREEEDEMWEK